MLVITQLDIWSSLTIKKTSQATMGNQSMYNTLLGYARHGYKVHLLTCTRSGLADGIPVVSRIELWDAVSRQALYIINSCRAYEFMGARWRSLWDYDLMDFFMKVPLEYRLGKRLYIQGLRRRIFTGPVAALAEIPIAGVGPWTDDLYRHCILWGAKLGAWPSLKKRIQRLTDFLDLTRAVKSLIHPKTVPYTHRFDCWFAGGRDPRDVRVGDVFAKYGTLEKVPPFLAALLAKTKKNRIDWMYPNTLLSAVMLGEFCEAVKDPVYDGERKRVAGV